MTSPVQVSLSPVEVLFEPASQVVRLGLIALATDLTTERDAALLVPHQTAALHVARIAYSNPTTPDNLRRMTPMLTQVAGLILPDEPVAAMYFACTSASVVIGERAVVKAIQAAKPGVPVVTPASAAVEGFAALGVKRVALVTPYTRATTQPMVGFFEDQGLHVIAASCLDLEDDRDMARVCAQTIIDAAIAADCPEADGIFLSCTGLPALGVIDTLEDRLGKPVVSSNQAALWKLLSCAQLEPAQRVGRLFKTRPPEAQS